jgi:gamma-glutamylcyclotransferase (GGCT)/AIG2-like uncharacterized protein YtfP
MTVMFAYGSNLNLYQMSNRCPDAVALGRLRLADWRLVFRGVADCIPEPGAVCYGGVWRITPRCEVALDAYEGIGSGLYRKEYVPIKRTRDGETEMLIYVMNSTGIMPPSRFYLGTISQGYRDFNMPKIARKRLAEAVRESWDDKAPTHVERQRHRRKGRPPLAAYPGDPAMPATGL